MTILNRRSFVKNTTGLGVLGLASTSGFLTGCSANSKVISKIGLQLYTVRDMMEDNVERAIAQVAIAGYKEVEFAGYFGRSAEQIKSTLDQNGLISPSVHIDPDELEPEKFNRVIQRAKTIGHDYVTLAWIPPNGRKRLDQYKVLIEELNVAGEMCKAAGLQLSYHNHDFEYFELEGVKPIDLLLSQISTDLMKFEMDLYWISKAGADPFEYFDRDPGRYTMCHLKDMGADGSIVDVGRGIIDFNKIFTHREQAGFEHYFVEMDYPDNILETIRYSIESAKKIQIS